MTGPGFGGYGLQIQMVIVVFWSELAHIMVDIAYGEVGFDAFCPHRFEEQKSRCTGSILCKGLVDAYPDRRTGRQFTVEKVFSEYFVGKCL